MRPVTSVLFLMGLVLQAQTTPPAPTKLATVEGITEYKLANGMQVLLFPDASKPKVTVNLTVLVGSRHEGYGESGMAHLLEHMLFKGTAKHGEIGTEIRNHGGEYNGSTSFDRTNYFETLPASDENLRWALDMESDRFVNSRVSRQDLDSEMSVVRNEFENGENRPERVLEERVLSTSYLWHGYGRSPIGSRSDIEKVPIERLQEFYRKYYQPDNAVLVVTGQFDSAKTLQWINETFGRIPAPTRKLIPTYTEEPTQDGEREVMLRRVGDTQNLILAYHIPSASHPDMAALDLLAGVLGDQPSGRLYKSLVDSKKATSAQAETYELKDPGVFLFQVSLRKEQSLADAEKATLDVIDGVIKEPPSKDEVERARTRQLKNFEQLYNNSERVGLILSEAAASGDWRLLFTGRDEIEQVTPEDVARVAKTYFKVSNRTVGRFIPGEAPDRAVVPASPDLAKLSSYKGKGEIEAGEVFDTSPANIEARVTRVTLPGGLKLVMLPKKNRGGTVVASLNLHFGDEKSLLGKTTAGQMAGNLLMRGTQKHSRTQLTDEIDKLKARVTVAGAANGASANVETVRANLPATLRLVAEMLKEPSFPESEMELIRQNAIARIEAQRSDPQQIAVNAFSRYLAPYPAGDLRAVMTVDENIAALKAVTLDEVKKFYAAFYGGTHADMAVVGDFDPAEIRKLTEELFGTWKSPAPYSVVKKDWKKLPVSDQTFETPDKEGAFFAVVTSVAMDQQDPDYPALYLANEMFGADGKARLWMRIREKEGLSYGVSSQFNAGQQEKFARFLTYAIANPGNIPKVEVAFKEELARLLKDGFKPEEVEASKKTVLQGRILQRSQDANLARLLSNQAELGRTMQREADLEKQIAGLTVEQLNGVVKKWLDPASLAYFKAGDFKKAGVTK